LKSCRNANTVMSHLIELIYVEATFWKKYMYISKYSYLFKICGKQ